MMGAGGGEGPVFCSAFRVLFVAAVLCSVCFTELCIYCTLNDTEWLESHRALELRRTSSLSASPQPALPRRAAAPSRGMRPSEFVHLRQQLEDELRAWALAAHTVERLRTRGCYESPHVGPAADSKLAATLCAGCTALRALAEAPRLCAPLLCLRRAEQAEGELEAVGKYLDGVSEFLHNDYVLLPRHVCAQAHGVLPLRPGRAGWRGVAWRGVGRGAREAER